MNKDFSLLTLFPVPVYISKIEISEQLKHQVTQQPFEEIGSKNGFMTPTTDLLNDSGFVELKKQIDVHVQDYVQNIYAPEDGIEFFLTTSWAMLHHPGNWSHTHTHANSIISGILYLITDPKSGDLLFTNAHNNLAPKLLTINKKTYNPYNTEFWHITPEDNQIVIFPSNLPHSVNRNESDTDRYCIAFNYFVKGTLGHHEGLLNIR
jgi:uncharacterized protein (TIGR02466 family)